MSEKNSQKKSFTPDQTRVFNTDYAEMPTLLPGSNHSAMSKFNAEDLDTMCKNPRQSAELIRYLIEFIKSL